MTTVYEVRYLAFDMIRLNGIVETWGSGGIFESEEEAFACIGKLDALTDDDGKPVMCKAKVIALNEV